MGLFEVLGDIVLGAIMESDSKLGEKTSKVVDSLVESDTTRKSRVLMDAQIKAHNSGNKELEERIKKERENYK